MVEFIIKIKRKIISQIPLRLVLFRECYCYYRLLCKHNASVATDKNMKKMQFTLLRENHVIEKGMSLENPRIGFGQKKVLALLDRLKKYLSLYGEQDKDFLLYPLSTIKEYILFTKKTGVEIPEIEESFCALLKEAAIDYDRLTFSAGVRYVSKGEIWTLCNSTFPSIVNSRHSIRYFTTELPTKEIIEKALQMAQRTPSACNRQAWHTYVFNKEDAHKLFYMQGGCNGFEESIHCAVLVTADMNGFLSYEPFQLYVDGGMYAMNLINAFHSLGMGTIPLSCGFYYDKLSEIKEKFVIPKNEMPIVIIGVGILQDTFKIAESIRKSIDKTNNFYGVWH